MISTAFAFGQRRGVLCKLSGIQELVYPSFSSIHVELFYVRPLTLEELKLLFLSLRMLFYLYTSMSNMARRRLKVS